MIKADLLNVAVEARFVVKTAKEDAAALWRSKVSAAAKRLAKR